MNKSALRQLLLVEDDPGDARLLEEMFKERGTVGGWSCDAQLTHVTSLHEAEKFFSEREADLVLLDLGLPDAQGLDALRRIQAAAPRVPLVVLTGLDDESLADQALQEGAQDYLIKGQIETRGLLRALRHAVQRKITEESLFVEKERAQVTLSCIGDAVVCTDMSGNITFLNLVAERLTGWSLQEAAGKPMVEVLRTLDTQGDEPVETTPELAILQIRAAHLPFRCTLIRRDGLKIPIEDSIAPIHDRQGKPTGAVIVFRDVSAAQAAAQQIAHSAQHDFLTGLPNRMLLNDRITQAIIFAQRYKRQFAVLYLDLDGFKHVNDSLGHPIGDKLLQSTARRIVNCVRGSDTVSRQGGDEFVVLLLEVPHPAAAVIMAGRMLAAVAKRHCIDFHELHVTTSIGASVYPDDGIDAEALIKNADTAMYQAKENGRNSFRFFTPAMNARAVERQALEKNLRRALEQREFELHYQPIINLSSGAIVGAEALLRWTHATRGPLAPAQFIPTAEDCGLMIPIGSWVVRRACEQARAWVDQGLPAITMAVNVSAVEFGDEQFVDGLFATLRETHLDPKYLELELTEGALMKRADSTTAILQLLRKDGVRVSVDDFGTGYSSLTYLRKLPIDTLKIDQSFVRQIASGGDDTVVVNAVITMARNLRLRVVAEGVETQAELNFLRAHQCDDAQGYYFSRPMPARQFAGLLGRGISKPVMRIASG
jgi:diguanylate cyclase (GGDEF)-like protein/PAS domain S-box-containing protein